MYRTYFPDPPGGLQEAIRQIALATQAQGVDSTIFTLSPHPEPSRLERPEGSVVRCRSWLAPASCDLGGLDSCRTFRTLVRQSDILVYHFPWPYADILHALGSCGKPSVMVYHSDIVRQRLLGMTYKPIMVHTLHSMAAIVATSTTYAQTSPILSLPTLRHKVRIIPLGIDEHSYPTSSDDSVFVRLQLHATDPYFLFVGVLRYYKGLHSLIRAAKDVNGKVVIAGTGPEQERLENLVKDAAVNNVIFAGRVTNTEKIALLRHCRAVVQPSHLRAEAFGMTLVEAAMFARPMISCEIGTGTSLVNKHAESGLVVPPEHPFELAQAMNCLLQETLFAKKLGNGARARYEKFFSGPALGKAYANLFAEMTR
nr:glycosyltransferase [Desulfobulbus propionicus]